MSKIKGKWALVTGASSGIGKDIAEDLARRGANVIVSARRKDRLEELAGAIRSKYGVETRVAALDLSTREAPRALFEEVKKLGVDVDLLINNAGFGMRGAFVDMDWERIEQMLQLNLLNLTALTHLYANDMKRRGGGYILQVASIGGFQPTPTYSSYAASKSYVLNFSEAINHELKGTGVSVTVLSPGATTTEFMEVAGHKTNFITNLVSMSSASVARVAVRALLARRAGVVAGYRNKIAVFLNRFVPRKMSTALAAAAMGS